MKPLGSIFTFFQIALFAFVTPLSAQSGGDTCGTPNNPEDDGGGGGGGECDAGNSSNGDKGPLTHAPTTSKGKSPRTSQSFLTPNGSNGWNYALDLEIHRQVSEIPFEFRRIYQSRVKSGLGDNFGHGLTWGHSLAWRMYPVGNGKRGITFPDGRVFQFTQAGNYPLDGATQILHNPENGRGERLYQGGVGNDRFTLVMPDSRRHVFDRVTDPDATVIYHPRYSQDTAGRRINYTSDAQGRIISATDGTGTTISLEYGAIQINRKASILLHEVTVAPSEGWNEILLTTPQPFRWFQAVSAKKSFFNLAEIEFYAPDGYGGHTKLTGATYGTNPAHRNAQDQTFDKAFDGDVETGYYHARPGEGIAGVDLGVGKETHLSKILFRPRTGQVGAAPLGYHNSLQFEGVVEGPEIVEVLQRVTCSDGRAVNYLYDTIVDESIGQSHLVLSGVDYDGDMLAAADTDARFTYVISNPGRGPSVSTFHEPRTTHSVADLKFEYRSTLTATRGLVGKVFDASTNEVIFDNSPKLVRKLTFPGDRQIAVGFNEHGNFDRITDADGNQTTYTYDANGFATSMTDPGGRTTTYTYNFRGQRTSTTTPDGMTESIAYDASTSLMTQLKKSAPGLPERITQWIRDASGMVTRKNYPDGSYETYTYNTLGLVTSKRERNGSLTTRTYDATGLCLTFTQATGTPDEETVAYAFYGNNDPSGSPSRLLKSETDPRGRTTSFKYNLRGQVIETTYPDGSSRAYSYDFAGNKISETDGIHTQLWTYNGFNKLTSMTDTLGHFTQYYYGTGGIVCGCFNGGGPTMIVSPEGRLTLREYDKQWRLSKETVGHTSPEAATTEYLYDIVGNLAMEVFPGGVTRTATYDVVNRPITETITGPDGRGGNLSLTIVRAYDPFGNTTSLTKPGNRITTMTYDVMDRTSTITDAVGTVTRYTYDSADNRTAVTEDLGGSFARTSATAYDLLNRPILSTFPDATTNSATYHKGGNIKTRTDELGRTVATDDSLVTWQDSKGNTWQSFVATTTDALGQTSSTHPKPMARFAGTTMSVSAMGRITEQHHNADGTTAQAITGLTAAGSTIPQDPSVVVYTYDDDHLILSQTTDPTGLNLTTSYTYDARSNRLTSTDPLNRITKTTYDLRGNAVGTELPDSRKNTAVFDVLNRRVSTTDPKSQTITYTFLQETNQTLALTDAKNQTTTWSYNALDQILTKSYPNGDTHTYTYDSLHRMATHRTPKLEICTYTYDLRDRQTLADWNSTTPDTAKTYWANGLLKSIDNGVSKSDYAYSLRNELTSETQTLAGQAPKVVTYGYDADGLRGGIVHPSARIVELAWTARAQLQAVTADGPPPFATYVYDKAGRITGIAHENGVTEAKIYNAASELLSNVHQLGGTMVGSHAYGYDLTGRRTSEQGGTALTPVDKTFGYDTADQITSATYGNNLLADTYDYDPMGNRTTATVATLGGAPTTYTANNANQYTSISGISAPSHDANGNLVQQNNVTYDWDSDNRLLAVSPNTPALGDRSLVHNYDGQHRRVTRTIREWTTTGWADVETIHFIYDGWNVIEEYALAGGGPVLRRTFTWGADLSGSLQGAGGVGGLLMTEEISGTTTTAYHFHYDGNGNVTEITDNTGSSAASYRYDAFGNTLVATGPYAGQNRYRFSTKPLDAEVVNAPLYYYGYRYYDPTTGRWPSRDPIGEKGGLNLYEFVGNNGLNLIDILGMQGFGCEPCADQCPPCGPVGEKKDCEDRCRNAKLKMKCGPGGKEGDGVEGGGPGGGWGGLGDRNAFGGAGGGRGNAERACEDRARTAYMGCVGSCDLAMTITVGQGLFVGGILTASGVGAPIGVGYGIFGGVKGALIRHFCRKNCNDSWGAAVRRCRGNNHM